MGFWGFGEPTLVVVLITGLAARVGFWSSPRVVKKTATAPTATTAAIIVAPILRRWAFLLIKRWRSGRETGEIAITHQPTAGSATLSSEDSSMSRRSRRRSVTSAALTRSRPRYCSRALSMRMVSSVCSIAALSWSLTAFCYLYQHSGSGGLFRRAFNRT